MSTIPGSDAITGGGSPLYSPGRGAGGVFANWIQGATPKYARNSGDARPDLFRDSLARIFVRVDQEEWANFERSFADDHTRTQLLPRVAGDPRGTQGYVDFIIQDMNLNFEEKIDVKETLGDNYVLYTFGQGAPTASFQGVLINTVQDDQATNFLRLYLQLFRATELARRQKSASIKIDSFIFTGVMSNLRMNYRAAMEVAVPFSFNFIIKKIAFTNYTIGWRPTSVGTPFATDLNAVPADARLGPERPATAVAFSLPPDLIRAPEQANASFQPDRGPPPPPAPDLRERYNVLRREHDAALATVARLDREIGNRVPPASGRYVDGTSAAPLMSLIARRNESADRAESLNAAMADAGRRLDTPEPSLINSSPAERPAAPASFAFDGPPPSSQQSAPPGSAPPVPSPLPFTTPATADVFGRPVPQPGATPLTGTGAPRFPAGAL